MIFVDSSVWVDYFNGRNSTETDCLDKLLGKEPIGTGDLVLIEVLQGFKHDRDYNTATELLTSLKVFTLGGQEIAQSSSIIEGRIEKFAANSSPAGPLTMRPAPSESLDCKFSTISCKITLAARGSIRKVRMMLG